MKLNQLLSFTIGIIGMIAIILLTAAVANYHLTLLWYIFWMAVATLVLTLDSIYLESHFIDGEWV